MKRIPLRDKLIPHGERLKEAFWQLSVASSGYAALDTLMEEIDTRITTLMDTIDQIPDGFVLPRKDPWYVAPGMSFPVLPIYKDKYGSGEFEVVEYGLQCLCRRADGVLMMIPRSYLASPYALTVMQQRRISKRTASTPNGEPSGEPSSDQP